MSYLKLCSSECTCQELSWDTERIDELKPVEPEFCELLSGAIHSFHEIGERTSTLSQPYLIHSEKCCHQSNVVVCETEERSD